MNRLLAIVAGAILGPLLFTSSVLAQSTEVNFQFMDSLWFVVLNLILAILGILGTWVLNILKTKFNLDIDQRNRDALHSAAKTGVEAAIAKYGPLIAGAKIDVSSPFVAFALQHILNSVPGALKGFGVDINSRSVQNIVLAKAAESSISSQPTVVNIGDVAVETAATK